MKVSEITIHPMDSEHSIGCGRKRLVARDCGTRERELSRSESKVVRERSWVRMGFFLLLNRPGIQHTDIHCKLYRRSELPSNLCCVYRGHFSWKVRCN
jgi:hypothetical protein